jgi:hypothetical protein
MCVIPVVASGTALSSLRMASSGEGKSFSLSIVGKNRGAPLDRIRPPSPRERRLEPGGYLALGSARLNVRHLHVRDGRMCPRGQVSRR